jgi:hypothetical protein
MQAATREIRAQVSGFIVPGSLFLGKLYIECTGLGGMADEGWEQQGEEMEP